MPAASLYLKLSTIAVLLFMATYLLRRGAKTRAIASGLFALSIAAYLGCQICHLLPIPWLVWLIHAGCFSVPVAFFVLGDALFNDRFRFRLAHLLLLAVIETVNFYLFFYLKIHDSHTLQSAWLVVIPQCLSFATIAATLIKIMRGGIPDLVESRRRFRLRFLATTGAAMLLVLVKEFIYAQHAVPPVLDLLHAAAVLALVWYFGMRLFRSGADSFGEEGPRKKYAAAQTGPKEADATLLARLERAMTEEKIFMRENLSIGRLAEHLGTREYILRRAINAALGYRNFNDYLNEFRIREAQHLLVARDAPAPAIIRIAMDLGFGSLAPFNRAFKEKTGMSPSEFRKTRQ